MKTLNNVIKAQSEKPNTMTKRVNITDLLSRMRANVRGYHNADVMPRERIDSMSYDTLLCYVHPLDRKDYAAEYKRYQRQLEKEMEEQS